MDQMFDPTSINDKVLQKVIEKKINLISSVRYEGMEPEDVESLTEEQKAIAQKRFDDDMKFRAPVALRRK